MKFLISLLHLLVGMSILLIPVFIIGVGNTTLPNPVRRLIIATMVVVATVFAVSGILKPSTAIIAGSIANVIFLIYLTFVFVAAYQKWSH